MKQLCVNNTYSYEEVKNITPTYDVIIDTSWKITSEIKSSITSKTSKFYSIRRIIVKPNVNYLKEVVDLYLNHNWKPIVDKIYDINEIEKAFKYVASNKKVGSVILKV